MRHSLDSTAKTLHGRFSNELTPALEIDPGDTVVFRCLDSKWGLEPYPVVGTDRTEFPRPNPGADLGHALTGPVRVRGAKPGQVLAVRIDEIIVGDWGQTYVGGFPHPWNIELGIAEKGILMRWIFDETRSHATNQFGHQVALRPFMGIYGMPSAEPGDQSTVPPRRTGGNLDCKELVAGSTLYLPIEVDGALFSTGDGHATQGDGEICTTAIECPMERIALSFDLVDDWNLDFPVAETTAGWVAMGLHEDLDEALKFAIHNMASLIEKLYEIPKLEALGLASVAVDFRITQAVNRVRGVHGILAPNAIRMTHSPSAP